MNNLHKLLFCARYTNMILYRWNYLMNILNHDRVFDFKLKFSFILFNDSPYLSFSWFQGGKFDVCFKYTRKSYSNKYNYTKIVKNNLNDIWYITRVALKTLLVLSRLISQKKTNIFDTLKP